MLKKKLIVLMVAIFTCMAVLVSQPQAMKPGQGGVKPPEQPGSQNLQQKLKEMRENIAAHGWHYTVGPNPAMYRSLDELCGFKAFMDTPSSKDHWAGGTQAPATPQLAYTSFILCRVREFHQESGPVWKLLGVLNNSGA